MIFKRYSSPFLFLDNLMIQGRFSDGIDTIYKQVDEEKMWQLYLSIPMKEKSYYDWKNEVLSKDEEPSFEASKDINEVKEEAKNILKNFKPE